jgi:hypothetical protein
VHDNNAAIGEDIQGVADVPFRLVPFVESVDEYDVEAFLVRGEEFKAQQEKEMPILATNNEKDEIVEADAISEDVAPAMEQVESPEETEVAPENNEGGNE